MKKMILVLTLIASAAMFAGAASDAASLYVKCKGCHGASGEKDALGSGTVIKGQSSSDLYSKMKGYKEETYGGGKKAIMVNQAKKLSDEDMKALADYIAKF